MVLQISNYISIALEKCKKEGNILYIILFFPRGTPLMVNNNFSVSTTVCVYLPGVLKNGLPEILSQVQHIAANLSKRNLLKALIL